MREAGHAGSHKLIDTEAQAHACEIRMDMCAATCRRCCRRTLPSLATALQEERGLEALLATVVSEIRRPALGLTGVLTQLFAEQPGTPN
jgi:hypothetical protein